VRLDGCEKRAVSYQSSVLNIHVTHTQSFFLLSIEKNGNIINAVSFLATSLAALKRSAPSLLLHELCSTSIPKSNLHTLNFLRQKKQGGN